MKKRLGLFLCFILGLSLIGCKEKDPTPTPPDDNPPIVDVDELKDQRDSANKDLDGYVKDLSVYSSTNQNKIKEAISSAKQKIKDAKTAAEITKAVSDAKAEIDKLPTASAEALAKAIADAKKELDDFVKLADYSEANQKVILDAILKAKTEIDKCTTPDAIKPLVDACKKEINVVPTIVQEALVETVAKAKQELDSYITDTTIYSAKGLAEIARIISDAKENIDLAAEVEIIEAIVADAKTDLDQVLTIAGEKAQNALWFKNNLSEDTTGALATLSVDNNKVVMDSAGLGTVRLYIGAQDENKYSVFDAKITPEYRSIEQSSFSIRFRAWDTSHGYLMKIYDDHIDVFTAVWSDEKQGTIETLIVHNEFGLKDKEEAHLQILCHEWKKSVLVNGECIFTIDESERTVGKVYIDTWQTGLTFVDPLYVEPKDSDTFKAEYDELLWKTCINKTEQEKLAEAKSAAKEEIEGFITDLTPYSQTNQQAIADIIAEGKNTIDACDSADKIEAAVADIKLSLNAVKTIEREQFEADALAAKEEIEGYITDLTPYSEANQAAIAKIISDGKKLVDSKNSVEEMQEVVVSVKAELDAVLTIEEELALRATEFKNSLVDTDGDDIADTIKNYVQTDGSKVVFNTKALNLTRVHLGNRDTKYVVLDTKFTPDYQDELGYVAIYFRAWTRSDGYKLVITNDSIDVYTCAWVNGHVETLIVHNASGGLQSGKEVHLQILCHEWKKVVLLDGECIFSIEEDTRNAGYVFLETYKAGFTFDEPVFLEPTSSEAFKENYGALLDAPCVNKSEAELLEEYKEELKPSLDTYISDLTLYSEANQQVIADIISAGKNTIDTCTSKQAVDQAVEAIQKELDGVLTLEREEFLADIQAAEKEIDEHISDLTLYSEANQNAIAEIIHNGKLEVSAVESADEIPAIVERVKAALDEVLTLAQEGAIKANAFKDMIVLDSSTEILNDTSLYVEQNKIVMDTKALDGATAMFHVGANSGNGYSVFDTKIAADYRNVNGSIITIRFRAFDMSSNYKMMITNSSIEIFRSQWSTEENRAVETSLVKKDFGFENGKEVHLQILCHEWQKTVLVDGKAIFSLSEGVCTEGAVYIETWESGLTLIEPVYKEPTKEEFAAEYSDLLWTPVEE